MKIEKELQSKQAKKLYRTLAQLKKPEEVANFLRDLLTFEEIDEAVRRLEAVSLIQEGKTSREIAKTTNMSSATIARINYWLHHGTGGYQLALRKLATR